MRKKRIALFGCIMAAAVLLSGCQSLMGGQKEPATEKVTETETETETEKKTEKETETEKVTTESTSSGSASSAGSTSSGNTSDGNTSDGNVTSGSTSMSGNAVQETVPEDNTAGSASVQQYEEEMKQCPYCAHWFSTVSDGVSGSPFDIHMTEEWANDPAGGQTEQEMVQCPDCGNWYEAGNIFRNHICEGRGQ